MTELDFLHAEGLSFQSESDFFKYIDEDVDLDDIPDDINLIGSVNNYASIGDFRRSLQDDFEKIWSTDHVALLAAHTGGLTIPYYVYFDEDFPVFLTTANITDEMPPTIDKFLQKDPNLGRFWLSMEQMDDLRGRISDKYRDLIIPYFTGHRSEYSKVPSEEREKTERTIAYWAEDGKHTYKEFRTKYGILPTNIRFERPNHFKFGVKQEGVFTHQRGSIIDAWELFRSERNYKSDVKEKINTGGYSTDVRSEIFSNENIEESEPWAIKFDETTFEEKRQALKTFRARTGEKRWRFGTSEYEKSNSGFDAELVDDYRFSRTELHGQNDSVRVYPLDENDIDSQFRIYNLIQDHFDSDCIAMEV